MHPSARDRGSVGVGSGVLVSVAAAAGLLVGLRAIVHVELPRLRPLLSLADMPREAMGVAWSARALWPADLQREGLERMTVALAALVLSAALVATLNALILLAESAAQRRVELAVRSALGASPATLGREMARRIRALLGGGLGLGLVLGVCAGGLARALWPGPPGSLALAEPADAAWALAALLALLGCTYVLGGVHAARPGRAPTLLRAGTRAGADPGAVFTRKALTAVHTAVAGSLLVGALTLSAAIDPAAAGGGARGTQVYDATSPEPGAWPELMAGLAGIPGLEAESLAAPGALVGLGVRDVAVAECGRCSNGGMPAPLWTVVADHTSVGAGYFELAGQEVVAGRGFGADDGPGSEPVALVNETFARTAFERGQPIGKKVHVGSDFKDWYTVVGVVADARTPVLGAEPRAREGVYLSAAQRPPRTGVVLLRGSEEALAAAEALMTERGFAPGAGRPLAAHVAEARRPLRWTWALAAIVALLALVLAAHGVHAAALQTTRRRTAELAIRRAVGARPRSIVAYVLAERLRVVAWGLALLAFFGTAAAALLQGAAGLPPLGPLRYAEIAALLGVVALAASARAAREALAVDPAALLE